MRDIHFRSLVSALKKIMPVKNSLKLSLHEELARNEHFFNKAQMAYLDCLVLERIQELKKEGSVLSDVEAHEHDPDFLIHLYLNLADEVYKIPELAYPQ